MTGSVTNRIPTTSPISVLLPDGSSIRSTHTGELNLPQLPPAARLCHLFPHLTTGSLLSMGQLCDHDCTAIFTKTVLHVHFNGNLLLYGLRQGPIGHWVCTVTTTNCTSGLGSSHPNTSVPTYSSHLTTLHSSNLVTAYGPLLHHSDAHQGSPDIATSVPTPVPHHGTQLSPPMTPTPVLASPCHPTPSSADPPGHEQNPHHAATYAPNHVSHPDTNQVAAFTPNLASNMVPDQVANLDTSLPNYIPTINAILPANLVADRVAHYHAALFSPVMSTWCAAIDAGHLATFPALTSAQVRRHFPVSIPMHYGHMDQTRANLQSTKPKPPPDNPISSPPLTDRTHTVYVDIHHVTGKLSTDQTGRIPIPSTSGNNYLMVVYEYDSNFIHAEPLKSRSGPNILAAYQTIHDMILRRCFKPKLQRLDNEASKALVTYMAEHDVDVQLSPPNIHRRNSAERAIRTFQNHFVAGLSSVAPDFPMNLWDRLLPQAIQTLNLLRSSRLYPQLSAYAHVHGMFDYNRTPLAPPRHPCTNP
jgi:hypothetical protein